MKSRAINHGEVLEGSDGENSRTEQHGSKHTRSVDEAVMGVTAGTRNSFPRWMAIVALSLAVHEPFYHDPLRDFAEEHIVTPYKKWQASNAKSDAYNEMSPENKDALSKDRKDIAERTKEQKERIKERAEDAKKFKAKLYKDYATIPYNDIFFPIEYYGQGVSDDEMAVAKPYFRIKADGVEVADSTSSTHPEVVDLISTFMPPGSYERTKTSAVHALVHKLGPKSQDCVARGRLMVMAIATKYPSLQQNLYVQKFGDHERALFKIGGQIYILEGNAPVFPDKKTEIKKNEVMPFEVWLALYSGHERSEFEDRIEKHGPQSDDRERPKDYARATDNLVKDSFWGKDLDNVGTADSWFNSGNGGAGGANAGRARSTDAEVQDVPGSGTDKTDSTDRTESSSLLENNENPESLFTPNTPKVESAHYLDYPTVTKEEITQIAELPNAGNINKIYIRHAATIDKEVAQALVALRQNPKMRSFRVIIFETLNKMDEETAKTWSEFKGELIFNGFSAVPIHVMRGLSTTSAAVKFKAQIVSTAALQAFVGEIPGSTKMTDFFDIDDLLPADVDSYFDVPTGREGSNVPHRFRNTLTLEDCAGLSANATDVLSRYPGTIKLNNIPLTGENMRHLSNAEGGLYLTDIPPENLGELLNGKYNNKRKTLFITYNGEFPVEAAKAIYNFKGGLYLYARSISVEAARYLGRGASRRELSAQIQEVKPDALKELAKYKGKLSIGSNSITMDEELSEAFSKHEGILHIGAPTTISPEGVHHWKNFKGKELNFVRLSEYSEDILRGLAEYKGNLWLEMVNTNIELLPEHAKVLSSHKGDLVVRSDRISLEAFKYLMSVEGDVNITRLDLVTYEMAKAIAARFQNPVLSKYRVIMQNADVKSKRTAVLLHKINGDTIRKSIYKVMLDEIDMMKVNAPYRDSIKWEEE